MKGEAVEDSPPVDKGSSKATSDGRPLLTMRTKPMQLLTTIRKIGGEESIQDSGRKPPGANGSLERLPNR